MQDPALSRGTNELATVYSCFRNVSAIAFRVSEADPQAEIEHYQSGEIYLMLIKSNFLMSEIPIFPFAIAQRLSES